MNIKVQHLKKLADSILDDCVEGRVAVLGESWAYRAAGRRPAGALWPPPEGGGGPVTPSNCLALVDRCLLEILWEHTSRKNRGVRAAYRRKLGLWLARRFRYREKIYKNLKPDVTGKNRFVNWLCSGSSVDRLVLLLTHSCQLRCAYCTVAKYPADSSFPVIRRACDLLLDGERKQVYLQFFGGEPLLRFDLLKRAVEYGRLRAGARGKTISFSLTTNGLALDAEKLDFLEKNGFSVEVSCDGDEKENGISRPALAGDIGNAHKRLVRNLDVLKKRKIKYKVIMVVTQENLSRMRRNYGYLSAAGHKSIQVNYALGKLWRKESTARFFSEITRISGGAQKLARSQLVNYTPDRREPVALNSELSCDCDGVLYRETGLCIERDFKIMKERFRVGSVFDGRIEPRILGNTQFDNFFMLTKAYGRSKRLSEIVMNNVGFGRALDALRLRTGRSG
ncbi:MAG: hypothetical protein A2234_11295 [Elusimicrobia bacterium RIFOXYA2_FULL_58_8]|nr:MAG: hypothetical protein A2285_02855 [Elusimicrobia bacterium RIFOXYA12_FULL_57_11]OGS14524.1 MAG: hypothetical protein A2234_11295 [Elusimicrobia bacterium RIFOXYA2_FULL_58_8]